MKKHLTLFFLLCFSTFRTNAGTCPGDLDGDGFVTRADLLAWPVFWNNPCAGCAGDMDQDSRVTVLDYVLVQGQMGSSCGKLIPMELAGRALDEYPFFEYVDAFNQGEPIQVAVEVSLFPWLAGVTADIYLVEARSADQWAADPVLMDATADGFQSETFSPGSIAANIFTLSGSETLSAEAGLGLGRPYDVVLDLNQNGVLDDSDFIDGLWEEGSTALKRQGCYVVHDLTQPGPLNPVQITYAANPGSVTAGFEAQDIFYPSEIASMGQLPLIVISHGNGHNYAWYSHLGTHMASYGYVVMSHANNTGPGVFTASTTTLEHTDAFLDQLSLIGGGVLAGHIDSGRIVWLGHSRGGEGVTIAVNRIVTEQWTPIHYTLEDIVLVSAIAPVDFEGPTLTHPHNVTYHLWTGGSDSDVNGCANCDLCQTFHLHDRAEAWRQSISLHGVGHGDFHNGSGSPYATGPCLVGRASTHAIMKGYFLPLVKHYVEGNLAARDFLWRQWERFKPIGAPEGACVVVDLMYRDAGPSYFPIDDFDTQPDREISSSGGSVSFDLQQLNEGRMDDADTSFTDNPSDPMNGITLAGMDDNNRGIVLEFGADSFYELALTESMQNLTQYTYLQFRAAQAPRHLKTLSEQGDLTFTVTLIDSHGVTSSINIGAYGGGVEEPYQRSQCGSGVGWAAEFETIRIRISDFLNGGSFLDLTEIEAIRLQLGPSFGSGEGRLGLDDIAFSKNLSPPLAGALKISLLGPAPAIIPPGSQTALVVNISGLIEDMVPGSAFLHYRFSNGPFQSMAMTPQGGNEYIANLPATICGDHPQFYFSAEGTVSGMITLPYNAPATLFSSQVGHEIDILNEPLDTDPGWDREGMWAFGHPNGGGGAYGFPDPISGFTNLNVFGYNLNGDYENSISELHLTTPALDCSEANTVSLSFMRWLGVEDPEYDHAYVRISADGVIWDTIWENASEITDNNWRKLTYDITPYAANQSQIYLRWTMGVTDGSWQYCGWNIDDVRVSTVVCE